MIVNPPVLALVAFSILAGLMLLYSSWYGVQILRKWDLASGSEYQLRLERRTYLISTIANYVFGFQILSFFFFVYVADQLHSQFVGAMCAAGTLNLNEWGYRAVSLKFVNCLLSGVWLVINYTDNRAYDYPLIRRKYAILLVITPLTIVEAAVLWRFFMELEPDVITSCCGTLFSAENEGMASRIVSMPTALVEGLFFGSLCLTALAGGRYLFRRARKGYFFSSASLLASIASGLAFISLICLYFYESPLHHCPFCVLQEGYGYIGYPIYISFVVAAIAGLGVGALDPMKRVGSLTAIVPSIQRRLVATALTAHAGFAVIMIYHMIASNLRLH